MNHNPTPIEQTKRSETGHWRMMSLLIETFLVILIPASLVFTKNRQAAITPQAAMQEEEKTAGDFQFEVKLADVKDFEIEMEPKHYVSYGLGLYDEQKYGEAITAFNQAIKMDGTYQEAFLYRGSAYQALGKFDLAMADFHKAVTLNPQDPYAYNYRGDLYSVLKQYSQAIANYNQALKLNPRDAISLASRGYVYFEQNKHQQAIQDFDQAIKLNMPLPHIFNLRGESYLALKHYDQAIADFDQALKLNPQLTIAEDNRNLAMKAKAEAKK